MFLFIYLPDSFRVLNSQAPDVPELAHQGIFHLLRPQRELLCSNSIKRPLYLHRTDFMSMWINGQKLE